MKKIFSELDLLIKDVVHKDGIFLIEPPGSFINLHILATYGYLISKAKGVRPHFLVNRIEEGKVTAALQEKYEKISYSKLKLPGRVLKFYYLLLSIFLFFKHALLNNLTTFSWGEVYFGDLIYDTYLRNNSMGTLHRFDPKIVKTFYHFFLNSYSYKEALLRLKPKMVLVSHRVGISSGVFLRLAQSFECDIYSTAGQDFGTLFFNRFSEKQKFYEYTAGEDQLRNILRQDDQTFYEMFELIKERHFGGSFNADAKLAFSKRLYSDRNVFCQNFKLDPSKKNIFIMLHALTDHPLSHFNGMLFDDYCDWFLKTLDFAQKNNHVNWIFKQHPSDHFYPVKDYRFKDIASENKFSHILFLGQSEDFDTRSIGDVGDAVITGAGTAGFELSAFNAIPSIVAGDCPYTNSGFTVAPKTQKEYFTTLLGLNNVERLDSDKHKKAIATYVFVVCLSKVEMKLIPLLSHEEMYSLSFSELYFDRVHDTYNECKALIVEDFERYIKEISKKDFRALRTSVADFWEYYAESFKTKNS